MGWMEGWDVLMGWKDGRMGCGMEVLVQSSG